MYIHDAACVSAAMCMFVSACICLCTDVEFITYGGDFNTVLDTNLDKSRVTTHSDISRKPLMETINENSSYRFYNKR